MFTGIIETLGTLRKIEMQGANYQLFIESNFTHELKIDQSVAHNGVCLTVVDIAQNQYKVVAIAETLQKTNLRTWQVGDKINLERGMQLGHRLDGHLVQGHIDQTGVCTEVTKADGSSIFTFSFDASKGNFVVEKGSITINGVSLTVVDAQRDSLSVAIIPYTMQHTNFQYIAKGSVVNLEFDVIGKYISRLYHLHPRE